MATVIDVLSCERRALRSTRTGEEFCESVVLSKLLAVDSVFIHYDVIAPGHRASAPHSHSARDEVVLVLSGSVLAKEGEAEHRLGPLQMIAFRAAGSPHVVINDGAETASIMVIASEAEGDRVSYAGEGGA